MELAVIEHVNKRVLTTAQIAEAYGIESKSLMRNFQRNKDRFVEHKHYYALAGEELKEFKGARQNDDSLKFVSILYLWTEEGAFLLAKSISTDKAWQAYELLTKQYYQLAQHQAEAAQQALMIDETRFLALEERMQKIEEQLQHMTLHSAEQKRLQLAVQARVHQLTPLKLEQRKLFSKLYGALKVRYEVCSYRDIPQVKLLEALEFVEGNEWQL